MKPALPQVFDMGSLNGTDVSIVIPCYESSAKLKRTLWSIEQNADVPYELIVSEARQCVAKNRNRGLEKAKSDLIVMLDDDVILPPFFLGKLASAYAFSEEIGVVSAKMTNPDGTPQNNTASVEPGALVEMLPPGTCFMYSRERVGDCSFDEMYEASQWEDTDFMAQVITGGLKTAVVGACHILHDNNWTGNTDKTWSKNRARFVEKWPEFAKTIGVAA